MTTAAVTYATHADRTVVRMAGDLDFASVGPVTDELERVLAESAESLVLDLSGVGFLDSAGVKLLYELHSVMRSRGMDVRVVVPPGNPIRRTLDLTGAHRTLPIQAGLDDAPAG